jgi:hypothetical protein
MVFSPEIKGEIYIQSYLHNQSFLFKNNLFALFFYYISKKIS